MGDFSVCLLDPAFIQLSHVDSMKVTEFFEVSLLNSVNAGCAAMEVR